ncbi:MAG: acyl--CoA ligase [Humibacillus sp.]|nr:acyl--CoA ligase [Humibacillus sp.]MDN5777425.1 acyl--CoA ligase [Humibacillus sp.]
MDTTVRKKALGRGLHPQWRVDKYRDLGWWTDETLDGVFSSRVAERGDALAIVDPANLVALQGIEPRRLSWNELDAEVSALAARLLDHGIGRGDVVGVQLPNTIELVEVYLAAWRIGAIVSPLAMQYREHELVTMGNRASFATLLTCRTLSGRHHAAEAAAVADRIDSLRSVVIYDRSPDEAGQPAVAEHWAPGPASAEQLDRVARHLSDSCDDPNDCVTICWTSGTESEPKGVQRTHYDWLAFSWACVDAPNVVTEDVLLNPFPMINMAGICGMLLPWLRTGSLLVQHHPFDPPTFFGQIARERVTYTLVPPALLWALINNEEMLARVDLSSLTRVGSGSAPLQPPMVRGWQQRFGISVINFFGSNEGVGLLSNGEDFPDPDERASFFPRYGAPGTSWASRVSEWIELKLIDQESGEEITEPGRPGELHISGPMIFPGYVGSDAARSPFDDDGFLCTGDVFEISGDQGQYLHFLDRAKDVVIRGGMNIAPAELEGMIAAHPAVAEVAVIGDPDEVMGERVAAVVVLADGQQLELDHLVGFLQERKIASYKLPERLEVIDVLPRNPVGKLLKRELRRAPAFSPGPV